MNNSVNNTTLISAILLLLTGNLTFAVTDDHLALANRHDNFPFADRNDHDCGGRRCVSAREIDPGQAMGALLLVAGSIAIIRGYRRKKK